MPYPTLLDRFTQLTRAVLGENLVGVYLHGSLAMGCFHPQRSDIDLIVVVRDALSEAEKIAYLARIVALNRQAPEKGIEMSVVRAAVCRPFVYPTPYEFHFSNAWLALAQEDPQAYVRRLCGTDTDLAAHFTVIVHRGVVLYGRPIAEVFAPVPRAAYWESIWLDVENAVEDIQRDPVYMTLNLCRVLAYVREGQVLSKREGGEWGERNLPAPYSALVREVLACYAGEKQRMNDEGRLTPYAAYMIEQIRACAKAP